MWDNFFVAGGFGMFPTLIFGFLLLAATALNALRPEPRYERVVFGLGIVTLASGLLGTCVGICKSVHYLEKVPKDEQLQILAMGTEESLHNLVLALLLLVVAGLVYTTSTFRRRAS
jgi:hypothetical protein